MLTGPQSQLVDNLFARLNSLSPETDDYTNIEKEIRELEKAKVSWGAVTNVFGQNLAHFCALKGLASILQVLIWRNRYLDLSFSHPEERYTPLHLACIHGNAALAKLILEIVPKSINQKDMFGMTPADLVQASLFKAEKKEELLGILRTFGADFSIFNNRGERVLQTRSRGFFAQPRLLNSFQQSPCHFVHYPEMRQKLENLPVSLVNRMINHGDANGRTPLMYMASYNCQEGLNFLLDKEAEINLVDAQGRSALFYAAFFASPAMISQLLERGASPLQKDRKGLSPLDVAKMYGRTTIVDLFQRHQSRLQAERVGIFQAYAVAVSAVNSASAASGLETSLQQLNISRSTNTLVPKNKIA